MSVPIPPPDQTPLWRRIIIVLLLAVWPVGGFILLLGSAAGEESVIGRDFIFDGFEGLLTLLLKSLYLLGFLSESRQDKCREEKDDAEEKAD